MQERSERVLWFHLLSEYQHVRMWFHAECSSIVGVIVLVDWRAMESVEEVYLPDGGELGHMTELVSIGKLIPTGTFVCYK